MTAIVALWLLLPVTVMFAVPLATPVIVTVWLEIETVATLGVSEDAVNVLLPDCETDVFALVPAARLMFDWPTMTDEELTVTAMIAV